MNKGTAKMKYQLNRGNFCEISECNFRARFKGLCSNCYQRDKKKKQLILKKLVMKL